MNPDLVGWGASVVLIATVVKQVVKQWNTSSNDGVSAWLFVGQIIASAGFVAYSWMLGNSVFMLTNAVLLAAAVTGECLFLRNRWASARDKQSE